MLNLRFAKFRIICVWEIFARTFRDGNCYNRISDVIISRILKNKRIKLQPKFSFVLSIWIKYRIGNGKNYVQVQSSPPQNNCYHKVFLRVLLITVHQKMSRLQFTPDPNSILLDLIILPKYLSHQFCIIMLILIRYFCFISFGITHASCVTLRMSTSDCEESIVLRVVYVHTVLRMRTSPRRKVQYNVEKREQLD